MQNKENFQILFRRLMISFVQYRLNRFMHPLLNGNIYNNYSRMWNMLLIGLEMSFLQGLHNVITKPTLTDKGKLKHKGQFSIHTFVPEFESQHLDLIDKIDNIRKNSLSHLNEKVKSWLDEEDYKNIQNIFDEVIEAVKKEAPKYLDGLKEETVDIRKIYQFEARETVRDFKRLLDSFGQRL